MKRKEQNPLISIVTVSYNAVTTIEQTIQAVINQTYKNIEYIIIDGGSTDGTLDIIKKYKDKISYWVSEPDKGIYDAMNKGIKVATGEWINFMNAGDSFYDNKTLERTFNQYYTDNTKVIYGDMIENNGGKSRLIRAKSLSVFTSDLPFCHQSSFLKNGSGYYDTDLRIAADYKLFRIIYSEFGEKAFAYVSFPISIFEASGISSLNKDLLRKEYHAVYREYKDIHYYWDSLKNIIKKIISYGK